LERAFKNSVKAIEMRAGSALTDAPSHARAINRQLAFTE
jgi:hypothetical protein